MNSSTNIRDVQASIGATVAGPRFEGLDLLRLFAASSVVFYHYTFRGAAGDEPLSIVAIPSLAPFAKYGYLGVELFFVISGFVISFSAQNRSTKDFAIARICRLYPAYLFCVTVTFAVTLAIGGTIFHASFGKWLVNAAMVTPAVSWRWLMDGSYWSIFAEMVFYAWVAVLMATGLFARHLTATMFAWLLISAANQLCFNSVLVERLLLTGHSGFFAAGVMLYMLRARAGGLGSVAVLVLATLLGGIQAVKGMLFSVETLHAPLDTSIVVALAVLSVALVAAVTTIRRLPISAAWVAALGGMTYPLYLLHQHVGYMIFNRWGARLPAAQLILLASIAMIATSYLIWRFIDRPGQRLMRRELRRLDEAVLSPALRIVWLHLSKKALASSSGLELAQIATQARGSRVRLARVRRSGAA